jgi:hypothetical protein
MAMSISSCGVLRTCSRLRRPMSSACRSAAAGLIRPAPARSWLRAEGFEWVQARAAPGGAGASPLACAGFTADPGTDQADGRTRLVLF